jgi:transposase-like protein
VFLPVRPDGPKEGVLVAWGFSEDGERVLLAVMLGMRESQADWLELGRDLIVRTPSSAAVSGSARVVSRGSLHIGTSE